MRNLFRSLAITALLAMALSSAAAQDATEAPDAGVTLGPLSSETFMVEGVVPEGWPEISPGVYTRAGGPGDETWLIIQAAPAPVELALSALQQQLRLTEPLEADAEVAGQTFEWTLYAPVVAEGDVDRVVRVATAHVDGRTYIVLLQSTAGEADTLTTAVLEPVIDALRPLVEATPEPGSLPYTEEEVTFENGDVALAGTLSLPEGDGPHPAVLLVTGSGPQDRDESLEPVTSLKPFKLIADHLVRQGIAVLRYDDRGVGQSTGVFEEGTIDDFAADAAAGIDYLRSRDEVDPAQVGILGHSEGGLVATKLVGGQGLDLAFVITLAGSAVNGRDMLLLQNERLMEVSGASEEQIQDQLDFLDAAFALMNAQDWDALEALLRETITEQYNSLPEAQQAALGDLEAQVDRVTEAQMQAFKVGWFASLINYDPADDWAKIDVPVLAMYGGRDVQVVAEQNAPALEAIMDEAGHDDVTLIVYPDANHLFQSARTGALQEYGTLDPEFVPDLLPDLTTWLLERVDVAE